MRPGAILALLLLTGCGHSPTGPDRQPQSITVQGTLTDTVSGAILGTFSQQVSSLPALVNVSAAWHLPRLARISGASPTVDLIPDTAPFDLAFYRQLVRNGLEQPNQLQPIRVLSQSPSIYLQRTGLSDATVAALEQAARSVIPAMTGGRLTVAGWETGDTVRQPLNGWITVELVNDEAQSCGRGTIGAAMARIWLNTAERCHRNGDIISTPSVFAHEIGHALGFWHTSSGLMTTPTPPDAAPSAAERYHGAIAYARQSGNTDVDQDALTTAGLSAVVVE